MDPLNSHTINLRAINNNLWSNYMLCDVYMCNVCVQSLQEPDIYEGLSTVLNFKKKI